MHLESHGNTGWRFKEVAQTFLEDGRSALGDFLTPSMMTVREIVTTFIKKRKAEIM